jgi:GT2 family glycosyltransferase
MPASRSDISGEELMQIATVIVDWNQANLTLDCIGALLATGVAEDTIWLVDNGSQPAAGPQIHARFPAVQVLRLEANAGFAGGCNAGARAALNAGAALLLFLNNDALIEPGALPALSAALAADPHIAAVSPKVYYHNTQRIIQSVGLRVDPDSGTARMIGTGEPDRGQYDQLAERDALFGCALLIRRAAWEQIGEFWAPFFNYAEEVDWCLRARRQGWRLVYVPQATVWHRTSSSLGADSPLKVYLIARNQWHLRGRHQRGGWRGRRGLAYALYINARTWLRYLRSRQNQQARALALGLWDYWRGRTGNARAPDLRLYDIDR